MTRYHPPKFHHDTPSLRTAAGREASRREGVSKGQARQHPMVATLGRVSSAREAADYYVQSQASHRPPGDYYVCGEEPDGRWWNPHGLFGLEDGGRVLDKAFYRLHAGIDPVNPYREDNPRERNKLNQNIDRKDRTAALDLTFSADKSVSTLWAMSHGELHDELAKAHDDAVRTALDLIIAKHASLTRHRPDGGALEVIPAKIMAAMFQHGSSRAGDPQLHTHCVIFNAALADDGKWRTLHSQAIYAWYKTAGSVYKSALAWNLEQRLGLQTERHGRDGEDIRIKGVPQELQSEWSKRRRTIVAETRKLGASTADSPRLAQQVNLRTRQTKQQGLDTAGRAVRWDFEARAIVEDIQAAIDALPKRQELSEARMDAIRKELKELPDALTENNAIWKMTNLIQRVSHIVAGVMSPEHIEELAYRVLDSAEVLELDRWGTGPNIRADLPGTRIFTTRHHLETERKIGETALRLFVKPAEEIPEERIDAHLERLHAEGRGLSGEQENAVRAACSDDRNLIIEGAAGSGKTTTLVPITELATNSGWKVYGTAQAWRTAKELASHCHIPAWCTQTLLNKCRNGSLELDEKSMIIVDEAGQLSVRHTSALLDIAAATGAKIIWAGDTSQQQPIGAGPGLRLLRDAIGSVQVIAIRRQRADAEDVLVQLDGMSPDEARQYLSTATRDQRDEIVRRFREMDDAPEITPWQIEASEALRDGKADEAIAAYNDRGRFHLGEHLNDTLRRLVEDWQRHKTEAPEESSLVIARTHDEIGALTPVLRELTLSDEQRAREVAITVTAARSTSRHPQPKTLLIAPGERLVIRANVRELDLYNGDLITVDSIETRTDPEGREHHTIHATTDKGNQVNFKPDDIRDWGHERGLYGLPRFDYGYAMTFSAAQGATVDQAFVLADDKTALETIYPSLTRHRDRLDIYANAEPLRLAVADDRPEYDDEKEVTDQDIRSHLATAWSRSEQKEAAVDYVLGPEERPGALEKVRTDDSRDPSVQPSPSYMSTLHWLRSHRSDDRETPFIDKLIGAARQDAANRNHYASFDELLRKIDEVYEGYLAVTRQDREAAEADKRPLPNALRSPDFLDTIRKQRAILPTAREALTTINKLPERYHAAARAGLTREVLQDWIRTAERHDHTFRAAAGAPDPAKTATWRHVKSQWDGITDAARIRGIEPIYVPGWRKAVDDMSAAQRNRTIPERHQRSANGILESQRTAYRYDRQAKDLVQTMATVRENIVQLRNVGRQDAGAPIDWHGIEQRRQDLQDAFNKLPPDRALDPYLAHYHKDADEDLAGTMLSWMKDNLPAIREQELAPPAREIAELVTQAIELTTAVSDAARDRGIPALADNAALAALRETASRLDAALAAAVPEIDAALHKHDTDLAKATNVSQRVNAYIERADTAINQPIETVAQHVNGLVERVRQASADFKPFANDPMSYEGPIRREELRDAVTELTQATRHLPPPDEMDAAFANIGADLTTSRIRGLRHNINLDLSYADKAHQRDAEALGASYDEAMSMDGGDWWSSELPASASQEIEPPWMKDSLPVIPEQQLAPPPAREIAELVTQAIELTAAVSDAARDRGIPALADNPALAELRQTASRLDAALAAAVPEIDAALRNHDTDLASATDVSQRVNAYIERADTAINQPIETVAQHVNVLVERVRTGVSRFQALRQRPDAV